MLDYTIKVPSEDIRKALRILKTLDKGMADQLRTDIKSDLKPYADKIAGKVPTTPPLSGMAHSGRTRWTGAKGSVSFTPGTFKPGREFQPLIKIVLQGRSKGSGFDIAEIAGSAGLKTGKPKTSPVSRRGSSKPFSRQNPRRVGKAFLNNIEPRSPFSEFKAGRFGYGYFLQERKAIQKDVIGILDSFAKKFNRRVR